MSKICRPPSAAGKFFTWGASSLGTFAIFKLSAPILEGGGTHFTLGSVHFSPFLLRELQGRVKKFSAALPRRHPREAAPPYFFTSGVDQKNFFTQGCTTPLPQWSETHSDPPKNPKNCAKVPQITFTESLTCSKMDLNYIKHFWLGVGPSQARLGSARLGSIRGKSSGKARLGAGSKIFGS